MIAIITFNNKSDDSKFIILDERTEPIEVGIPVSISNELYMRLLSVTELVDGLPQRKFDLNVISMKDESTKIQEPAKRIEKILSDEDRIAMTIMSEVDYFASIFNQLESVLQLEDNRTTMLGSIEIYKKINNLNESVMKGNLDESAK